MLLTQLRHLAPSGSFDLRADKLRSQLGLCSSASPAFVCYIGPHKTPKKLPTARRSQDIAANMATSHCHTPRRHSCLQAQLLVRPSWRHELRSAQYCRRCLQTKVLKIRCALQEQGNLWSRPTSRPRLSAAHHKTYQPQPRCTSALPEGAVWLLSWQSLKHPAARRARPGLRLAQSQADHTEDLAAAMPATQQVSSQQALGVWRMQRWRLC